MKKIAFTFLLLLSILFGVSSGKPTGRPQEQKSTPEILNVSLCQLVSDPQLYDNKLVRLEAIYAVSFEWVLLYDCECSKRESYIYPIVEGDTDELTQAMDNEIASNLRYGRNSGDRVGLVMTGIFLAPKVNRSGRDSSNVWPNVRIKTIEKFIEIPKAATAPADCPSRKK